MAPIFLWLVMILCLLISVVKYVMGIILKLSFPSTKIQKDYTYQPTVSVLMPCFNEGKTVYETIESISKSNYPNEKFEVIAQDDCSVDDSYEWMLNAQRDFTNIRIRTGRNEVNSGKARTVCNALQHSTAEIIISIDSDCIFHEDAIAEVDRLLLRGTDRLGRRQGGSPESQRRRNHCHSSRHLLLRVPALQDPRELDAECLLHQRMPIRHSARVAPGDRAGYPRAALVRHSSESRRG